MNGCDRKQLLTVETLCSSRAAMAKDAADRTHLLSTVRCSEAYPWEVSGVRSRQKIGIYRKGGDRTKCLVNDNESGFKSHLKTFLFNDRFYPD